MNWYLQRGKDSDVVVDCKVIFSRNLNGHRFNTNNLGEIKEIRSDGFENESVRIFNLICKINKTEHLYDFNKFDVSVQKK